MDEWIRKCDLHTQYMIDLVIKKKEILPVANMGELGGHYFSEISQTKTDLPGEGEPSPSLSLLCLVNCLLQRGGSQGVSGR